MGLKTSEHALRNLHISVVVPVSIDIWAYGKLCNEGSLPPSKHRACLKGVDGWWDGGGKIDI